MFIELMEDCPRGTRLWVDTSTGDVMRVIGSCGKVGAQPDQQMAEPQPPQQAVLLGGLFDSQSKGSHYGVKRTVRFRSDAAREAEREALLQVFTQHREPQTTQGLAKRLKRDSNGISDDCRWLRNQGLIKKTGHAEWQANA